MIGLIVNQQARRLKREAALIARIRRLGDEARVVFTASPEEVPSIIAEFAEQGVDIVGAFGGDGTLMYIVSEIAAAFAAERLPRLLPLRGGTMNTFVKNAGVGDPSRLLSHVLGERRAGRRERTVAWSTIALCEEGVDGQPPTKRCGFMFGAALAARFLQVYYGRGASPMTAARLAVDIPVSALVNGPLARRVLKPSVARIAIDGEPLAERDYRVVVAATLRDIGIGVKATYRGTEDPRRFHLVASAMPPRALAGQFYRAFVGRGLSGGDAHVDRLVERVSIAFSEREPYMFDGELFAARALELTCGPRIEVCCR